MDARGGSPGFGGADGGWMDIVGGDRGSWSDLGGGGRRGGVWQMGMAVGMLCF